MGGSRVNVNAMVLLSETFGRVHVTDAVNDDDDVGGMRSVGLVEYDGVIERDARGVEESDEEKRSSVWLVDILAVAVRDRVAVRTNVSDQDCITVLRVPISVTETDVPDVVTL